MVVVDISRLAIAFFGDVYLHVGLNVRIFDSNIDLPLATSWSLRQGQLSELLVAFAIWLQRADQFSQLRQDSWRCRIGRTARCAYTVVDFSHGIGANGRGIKPVDWRIRSERR